MQLEKISVKAEHLARELIKHLFAVLLRWSVHQWTRGLWFIKPKLSACARMC